MSDIITIEAWGEEIAITAIIDSKLRIELRNQRFSTFSPLLFENTIFADTPIKGISTDLSKIGIIEDSISGAYGKSFFDKYFINEKGEFPTVLDRLSFIGFDGLGALEFNPNDEVSIIKEDELLFSLAEFKEESISVYSNKSKKSELSKLIAKSNSGAGGAKAKAVVNYNSDSKMIHLSAKHDEVLDNYEKCIIKFNTKKRDEAIAYNEELRLEYVYYLLARKCGIKMSKCWLECDEDNNCYFITKRFDIDEKGKKLHLHSLAGILGHDTAPFSMGYEMLFRTGVMLCVSKEDKDQMFRTMAFNLIFANRDDHSRNFSFLMDCDYNWKYAPSYDLTYCGSNHNMAWNQLTIDKKPSQNIRSLAIIKIAKICDIAEPLEIMKSLIEIKRTHLKSIAMKNDISAEIISSIFEDTQAIDKIFAMMD